jgi:hypothetical protein
LINKQNINGMGSTSALIILNILEKSPNLTIMDPKGEIIGSDLQKALDSFKERFGVTFDEVITSKETRLKIRKKLDEETARLYEEFIQNIDNPERESKEIISKEYVAESKTILKGIKKLSAKINI